MSDQLEGNHPTLDPYRYLGFGKSPNGSAIRMVSPPERPASADPRNPFHLSKDIPINKEKNTWVRLLVTKEILDHSFVTKLPVIIYFHGGGFVICSAATSKWGNLYNALVTDVQAIIVSVEYRLAPEHRLPAAYEDCMEVLHWLKNSNDEWLLKNADISECFLMGTSAGGNICYHVGLKASTCVDDLKPLEIKGLILHQPFFGGNKRSDSEIRLENDMAIPPVVTDLMWDLSLPIGVDRDHEYSNPIINIKKGQFDQIISQRWRVLVTGCTGDTLMDRQIEFVKKLEEHGVPVVAKFDEGGGHCYDLGEPSKTAELCNAIKMFVADLFIGKN